MNENEKRSSDWKLILGGVVLIVVLFAAIKLIFWGLGKTLGQEQGTDLSAASVSQSAPADESEQDAPSFCLFCGKELPDSFEWGQFCPWCGEKNEK